MQEPNEQESSADRAVSDRPCLSDDQEKRVFTAAARRVAATVRRTEPEPLEPVLGEVAGQPLFGAFVSLKRAGQLRSCCGYLGDHIPLSEAVANAAVRAAKDDPRFSPIEADELDALDMEVWLLWNPEPVPGHGEARSEGFRIGVHGLQVSRSGARGLLLPGVAVDHRLSPREFLRQVCIKARLSADAWLDDRTQVQRFEGYSIRNRLKQGLQPPPDAAESAAEPAWPKVVRPAACAGQFYPGDREAIDRALDEMLPADATPQRWAGAMVPHAGWFYSGPLAARVFSRIKMPSRAIIIAPKHRHDGPDWSVAPHEVWLLPGGQVDSDPDLARRLAVSVSGLKLDGAAHRLEHAIEVQLPFFARLAPHTQVVGITVHGGSLADLEQFAAELAEVLARLPEPPLLVISSDMSHVRSDSEARMADRAALDAIESLDPARLYEAVTDQRITMCGFRPAVIVMETLRRLGSLERSEAVGYHTSADVRPGDRTVGYAGMLFA